jgi:hypothetical protein
LTFILPRRAEREYLTVYGIVAVYVVELPTGETMLGTSRDLLQSLQAIRRRRTGAAIVAAYWAKDLVEAQRVCQEAMRDSEGVLMNARTVRARIETAGDRMNLSLTDHETIMQRARMAVEYVEGKIAEAQAAGDLRWFNCAFREWRLEANARGRTMSYAEARARLRHAVYRQILFSEFSGIASMAAVFPTLDIDA